MPSQEHGAAFSFNSLLMNPMNDTAISREWRLVLSDLPVTFVWAYDTAAILPEYDDSEAGTLPAGQFVSFAEVTEDPGHFLCDLDDPAWVEKAALPRGRVMRFRPWCFATRLQVVLQAEDFYKLTTAAERPSRWRRLVRGIMR